MALSKLTKDMAIIQKLDDEPNDVGGLTAAELKAKFDEAGEAIKAFLNDTLLDELGGGTAADGLGAVVDGKTVSVQQALDLLQQASVQAGNVPVGGGAGDVLQKRSGALYDLEWRPLFTCVAFSEADWTAGEDGGCVLTLSPARHQRRNGAFSCELRHKVDGVLKTNTWAVLGTQTAYDAATGNVTLTAGEAYDGTALFCGGQQADEQIGVALLTGEHTGEAEVSALVEGRTYDAENLSAQAQDAPDGTLILTRIEED